MTASNQLIFFVFLVKRNWSDFKPDFLIISNGFTQREWSIIIKNRFPHVEMFSWVIIQSILKIFCLFISYIIYEKLVEILSHRSFSGNWDLKVELEKMWAY